MIDRFIYTLYLFSRKRKLDTHHLTAGTTPFLFLYIGLIALANLIFYISNYSFIGFFDEYKGAILVLTLCFGILPQFYSMYLLKKISLGKKNVKPLPLSIVFSVFACILLISLITLIVFFN